MRHAPSGVLYWTARCQTGRLLSTVNTRERPQVLRPSQSSARLLRMPEPQTLHREHGAGHAVVQPSPPTPAWGERRRDIQPIRLQQQQSQDGCVEQHSCDHRQALHAVFHHGGPTPSERWPGNAQPSANTTAIAQPPLVGRMSQWQEACRGPEACRGREACRAADLVRCPESKAVPRHRRRNAACSKRDASRWP